MSISRKALVSARASAWMSLLSLLASCSQSSTQAVHRTSLQTVARPPAAVQRTGDVQGGTGGGTMDGAAGGGTTGGGTAGSNTADSGTDRALLGGGTGGATNGNGTSSGAIDRNASAAAVKSLLSYLSTGDTAGAAAAPFATIALTKADAASAAAMLWQNFQTHHAAQAKADIDGSSVTVGNVTMRFKTKTFGTAPASGHSLYISMHGGGGTTAAINDQQWANQIDLVQPAEGIYLAPRAPEDAGDMWYKPYIDDLFDQLIQDYVVLGAVDPNRVYIMGYSAGGDGTYQLAPRMADRWAAAAMSAGYPNNASPIGLENIGFALHVGLQDSAYNRNTVDQAMAGTIQGLAAANPGLYKLHAHFPNTDHWMNGEDADEMPFMAGFVRNPQPKQIAWHQNNVVHQRFYWLYAADGADGDEVYASIDQQTVKIKVQATNTKVLTLRLNDAMVDMDQAVTVNGGATPSTGVVPRTIAVLVKTLSERGDPTAMYSGEIKVDLK